MEVYADLREINEVQNKNFQKVFTTESHLKKPQEPRKTKGCGKLG